MTRLQRPQAASFLSQLWEENNVTTSGLQTTPWSQNNLGASASITQKKFGPSCYENLTQSS
jgi:hypothetical protein